MAALGVFAGGVAAKAAMDYMANKEKEKAAEEAAKKAAEEAERQRRENTEAATRAANLYNTDDWVQNPDGTWGPQQNEFGAKVEAVSSAYGEGDKSYVKGGNLVSKFGDTINKAGGKGAGPTGTLALTGVGQTFTKEGTGILGALEQGVQESTGKLAETGQAATDVLGASRAEAEGLAQKYLGSAEGALRGSLKNVEMDPGYQFRQQQGEEAIRRAAAASGGRFGGNTAHALIDYNQNLASDEYARAAARQMGIGSQVAGLYGGAGQQLADLAGRQGISGAGIGAGLGSQAAGYLSGYGHDRASALRGQAQDPFAAAMGIKGQQQGAILAPIGANTSLAQQTMGGAGAGVPYAGGGWSAAGGAVGDLSNIYFMNNMMGGGSGADLDADWAASENADRDPNMVRLWGGS